MNHKKLLRKVCSVGLCLCLLLSSLPTGAFAMTEDGLCEHHPEHTEECGYVEGEYTCGYVCPECAQQEQPEEPEENPVEEPQEEPDDPENAPAEEPTPIADGALTEETATVKVVSGDTTTYYASFDAYMASEQYANSGTKAVTILKDTSVNASATVNPGFTVNQDVTLTLNANLTVLPDSLAGGLSVYGTIDGEGTLNYAGWIEQGTFKCPLNMEGPISKIVGGQFYNSVTIYGEKSKIDWGSFFGEVTISGDATINGGTFEGTVTNSGATIAGGTFRGTVKNQNAGQITGGTFSGEVDNYAMIFGGTFNGSVENYRLIQAGTFNDTVTSYYHAGNDYEGILAGGTFNAKLINYGYLLPDSGYPFSLGPNFSIVNYAIDADYGPEDGKLIICTNHILNDSGICRLCGDGCSHTSWTGEVCDGCGKACVHTYENGTCTNCGTKEPPVLIDGCYQIANASQLQWFAQQVNAGNGNIDGKLTANIDLSGLDWTPIGTESTPYAGTFDGNGKTISGLSITATGNDQGLFGVVNGGTVKNFTIKGKIDISEAVGNVGGVVGYAKGKANIENVTAYVTISDTRTSTTARINQVGGVVGNMDNSTIKNCENHGDITLQLGGSVGGVSGIAGSNSTITYCKNYGTVIVNGASAHVAGIGGDVQTGTAVTYCINHGDVTSGGNDCVGGVVGYANQNVKIENCGNSGSVKSTFETGGFVGGILGYINNNSFGSLKNCFNTGTITSNSGENCHTGAIVGWQRSNVSMISNNYYLDTSCAQASDGNAITDVYSVSADQFKSGEVAYLLNCKTNNGEWKQTIGTDSLPNFDGEAVYYGYTSCDDTEMVYTNDKDAHAEPLTHSYKNGFCSVCGDYEPAELDDGYYEIGNAGQLFWFAAVVNTGYGDVAMNTAACAILTADIDLENRVWYPIGLYNDPAFEGGGNVVALYTGVFNGNGHTVSNFIAIGTGSQGLIGYSSASAVVEKLGVLNATVSGWNAGAVLAYKGTVKNCYAVNCIVTASSTANTSRVYAGAVAGSQAAELVNCYALNCTVQAGEGETTFTLVPVGGKATTNCYYGNITAAENTLTILAGDTSMTAEQFASGEVAYLLNGNSGTGAWKQTIGTDSLPNFDGETVYAGYTSCADSAGLVYTNDSTISKTKPAHAYDGAGFCSGCDGYQPCTGAGTEASPYQIANAGNLYWFAQQVNSGFTTIHGKLTEDITVNTGVLVNGALSSDTTSFRVWTPIGTSDKGYTGTFDGDGKFISGLYFNDDTETKVGLFCYLGFPGSDSDMIAGTVKNVTVKDSYFYGANNIGGIVAVIYCGLVENCHNDNTFIFGEQCTGGICGNSMGGSVVKCSNSGYVLSEGEFALASGGIVGNNDNDSEVTECTNTGVITGVRQVGGIVGKNEEKITNCHNAGKVSGISAVGGVVGSNNSGAIVTNCYNTEDITGTGTSSSNIGGVVGQNDNTVSDCYNTGKVTGFKNIGGVVGNNASSATVSNCYNTNDVSGQSTVGGIVGRNSNKTTNCYNTGAVTGTGDDAYDIGGVVGDNWSAVSYCYNTGTVTGTNENSIYGVANGSSNLVTNCYYLDTCGAVYGNGTAMTQADFNSGKVTWLLNGERSEGTEDSPLVWHQKLEGETYPSLTGDQVVYQMKNTGCTYQAPEKFSNTKDETFSHPHEFGDDATCNGFCVHDCADGYQPCTGDGTEASPYLIANAGNLYWFAQQVNSGYTTIHGKLTEDITVNTGVLVDGALNSDTTSFRVWTPIGTSNKGYTGTFDGNGKIISGLYFNDDAKTHIGLFGHVKYTTDDNNIVGGTVKNVTVKDSYFCGYQRVGAIVGFNFNGLVDNCHNSKTIVTGTSYAGGIVGTNRGTITSCTNSGNILTEAEDTYYIGGIVGINSGKIIQCSNSGMINAESDVGGIVGRNDGKVVGCCNTGKISGEYCIGGIVGSNQNTATVSECYNTNEVSGNQKVGGIVGQNDNSVDEVTNCYNTGAVTGTGDDSDDIGGVVGNNSGKVSYCYNTGRVTGTSEYGIYGVADGGQVTNCYYLDTCGAEYGGTAMTQADFNSGKVTWLLNGERSEGTEDSPLIWHQTLKAEENTAPNFQDTDVVYIKEKIGCTAAPDQFSNKPGESFEAEHTFGEDGKCDCEDAWISVTITWGAMNFTYSNGTWNTETHTYDGAGWTAEGNTVTVENTGTEELAASVVYQKEDGYNFAASWDKETANIPKEESETFTLTLSGKPAETLEKKKVGTVTVTIQRADQTT